MTINHCNGIWPSTTAMVTGYQTLQWSLVINHCNVIWPSNHCNTHWSSNTAMITGHQPLQWYMAINYCNGIWPSNHCNGHWLSNIAMVTDYQPLQCIVTGYQPLLWYMAIQPLQWLTRCNAVLWSVSVKGNKLLQRNGLLVFHLPACQFLLRQWCWFILQIAGMQRMFGLTVSGL